jgi:hypothetical protein
LGEVLFSAQQFKSQVHKRIVGNCGTGLYGRMDMDELATPGYGNLSSAVKTKLATLPKGELMVRHPHFTQPVFVKFPRPSVMRGQDGRQLYPPQVEMEFSEAMVYRLRLLDRRLAPAKIKDAIADHDHEIVLQVVNKIEQQRPEDILSFCRANLKATPTRSNGRKVKVAPIYIPDESDDPFGD